MKRILLAAIPFVAVVALLISPVTTVQAQEAGPERVESSIPSQDPDNPIPLPPKSNEPEVLENYLASIAQSQPEERTIEAATEHIRRLLVRVDEVLKRDLQVETFRAAAGLKFSLLGYQTQLGVDGAEKTRSTWIQALQDSSDKKTAETGRAISILADLQEAVAASEQEGGTLEVWEPIISRTGTLLKNSRAEPFAAEIAIQVAEQLEIYGDPEWAAPAMKVFAKYFRESPDPRMEPAASMLDSMARKLELPGKPIEITGTTLDGQKFNIEQFEGKVVLVDFWATWCGFCIEAFPTLEELYKNYHDQGLEIVGVNIDDTRELFASYLKDNPLPWTHIQNLGGEGEEAHPNAARYGVTGIPFLVLVGRDGKVVAINVSPDKAEAMIKEELAKETSK